MATKAKPLKVLPPLPKAPPWVQLEEVSEKLGIVSRQLTQLPEVAAVFKRVQQIPFFATLLPGQGAQLTEDAPFDGCIKMVILHFPSGCNSLVDVAVEHGGKQFCPSPDYMQHYIALDDATQSYAFNEPVKATEPISVIMQNTDSEYSHSVSCTIMLEGG